MITATDKNGNRDANARLPKTDKSQAIHPSASEEQSDNYYNCMEIIPESRNRRHYIACIVNANAVKNLRWEINQ